MKYLNLLSKKLDISISDLFDFSSVSTSAYSTFNIRKKTGGFREISQPTSELKEIQYELITELLSQLPVHDTATAYQKSIGIKQNASAHLGKRYILKTDFKDFFPSISPIDLKLVLAKNNISLDKLEFNILSRFLFKKKQNSNKLELCIGAPSSPIISNIVLYELDEDLYNMCSSIDVSYTRYADDMTFSSDSYDEINKVLDYLKHTILSLESPKLFLNSKKTKIISRGRSQRVTGVVLSNEGNLSIGRSKRRRIRTLLHLLKKDSIDQKSLIELYSLISFLRNIEPGHYDRLVENYGIDIFKKLYKTFSILVDENKNELGIKMKFDKSQFK